MKTIGMLGGMSWQSTASYYKAINEKVANVFGGYHSAKICLYSVNFDELQTLQHEGKWGEATNMLVDAAKSVEAGGADFVMICTNTMHKVAPQIEQEISIPILHIADVTAQELIAANFKKVGLLGTQFTMQEDFYQGRLAEKFGIDVIVPNAEQQKIVHNIIYQELVQGIIKGSSRKDYLAIVEDLYSKGAEAIILGCTEIALLIQQAHTEIPLFDTTEIHADYAVRQLMDDAAV